MTSPANVLIVDDDMLIQELLRGCLASHGYQLSFTGCGQEALELLQSGQFDVAILDIMLPEIDGIDILRRVQGKIPHTEIIVLTGHASLETAIDSLRLGAYDYATKPFSIDTIRSTVKRAADRQRLKTRLAAIQDLSYEMSLSLDMDQVTEAVLDTVTRVLELEHCELLLVDKARDKLYPLAMRGSEGDTILELPLSGERGISVAVARSGEPIYAPDTQKDSRYVAFRTATRSKLAVPLQVREHVIGVLNVESTEIDAFSPDDTRLLCTLATQAAVAIENARLFDQVRASREQLQALSRRLVEVQEAERTHISREIHDETGQVLSSLLLGLSLLEREANHPEAVIIRAIELEEMVDELLQSLHRLAMNLRPAALDHLGLVAALNQYTASFNQQHDLTVQFKTAGLEDKRLPPAVETALYRIVQQALTNVLRHAQATHADVFLERRGDQLVTSIKDDGVGFEPETITQSDHLGLLGMRERAEMLGGVLTIESIVGTGTTVSVKVPYPIP